MARPTIADVAREAGVSRSTVSRVLNGQEKHIKAETRESVLAAMNRLGFRPNVFARSLRTKRSGYIGVLTENLENPFSARMLSGIQQCLKERQYVPIVQPVAPYDEDWAPNCEDVLRRQVDGVILVMNAVREIKFDPAFFEDVPVVVAYSIASSAQIPSIVPDEFAATVEGLRHLVSLGHRRIALIKPPAGLLVSQQREEAYRSTLQELGLEIRPEWIKPGRWSHSDSGRDAALEMLRSDYRPTAIFATNDIMAVGVLDAARECNLRVPQDLSVLGFDDRNFCEYIRPRLSTIRLPLREIGRRSAETILAVIDGKWQASRPVLVPARLVLRESTGAPMAE